MIEPFELDWLGGPAEAHFRRARPGIDDLPWGTLDRRAYPEELVERARLSWTESTFSEYCTAAAFAELLRALLEANAPVDLVGMAGSFVADEMLHVELNARMAMELGGGVPYAVDFADLVAPTAPGLTALQRASELAVRTCCVGEAFSVPLLAGTLRAATHPLTRAVLARIVKDEAPHARLGWLYLEWAGERIDAAERARLGGVARDALSEYRADWQRLSSTVEDGLTREGYRLADIGALGWMEASAYAAAAQRAVREQVLAPLARHGIAAREAQPRFRPVPGACSSS